MTQREAVIQEVEQLPDALLGSVLTFVRQLKAGEQEDGHVTALASEAVLAKDWLLPEEDEAWRDLY